MSLFLKDINRYKRNNQFTFIKNNSPIKFSYKNTSSMKTTKKKSSIESDDRKFLNPNDVVSLSYNVGIQQIMYKQIKNLPPKKRWKYYEKIKEPNNQKSNNTKLNNTKLNNNESKNKESKNKKSILQCLPKPVSGMFYSPDLALNLYMDRIKFNSESKSNKSQNYSPYYVLKNQIPRAPRSIYGTEDFLQQNLKIVGNVSNMRPVVYQY